MERQFHVNAGVSLLLGREFETAFEHFRGANLDPRELIYYFPQLQFDDFVYTPAVLRPMVLFKAEIEAGIAVSDLLSTGTKPIASYTGCHLLALFHPPALDKTGDMADANSKAAYMRTLGKGIHTALLMLLEAHKYYKSKEHDGDSRLTQAVDHALLKLYLLFYQHEDNKSEMREKIEDLVSNINAVEMTPSIVEDMKGRGVYHALALLYVSRKMYRQALQIWADIGAGM